MDLQVSLPWIYKLVGGVVYSLSGNAFIFHYMAYRDQTSNHRNDPMNECFSFYVRMILEAKWVKLVFPTVSHIKICYVSCFLGPLSLQHL